ncbi:hypothetical protein SOVF_150190 [Spinacia oleracea]|nr:hypothetical protein SOVF_150190 [Spinacia oleracea]
MMYSGDSLWQKEQQDNFSSFLRYPVESMRNMMYSGDSLWQKEQQDNFSSFL